MIFSTLHLKSYVVLTFIHLLFQYAFIWYWICAVWDSRNSDINFCPWVTHSLTQREMNTPKYCSRLKSHEDSHTAPTWACEGCVCVCARACMQWETLLVRGRNKHGRCYQEGNHGIGYHRSVGLHASRKMGWKLRTGRTTCMEMWKYGHICTWIDEDGWNIG